VNPLLDAYERAVADPPADADALRSELIARYAFAIPTDEALDAIRAVSPRGVVEIGAGTGYWARLLHDRGVEVAAYDLAPAPSGDNPWFAGTEPWHPVDRGDHTAAALHPERTLLIVWPTRNEVWAAATLDAYRDAGGSTVTYVGDGPGGHTGDDVFHARLGQLSTCAQCTYRSANSPCICGIGPQWRHTNTVPLPQWPGYLDDLHMFVRDEQPRGTARWYDRFRRPGKRTPTRMGSRL
jgi:hypothetical protein